MPVLIYIKNKPTIKYNIEIMKSWFQEKFTFSDLASVNESCLFTWAKYFMQERPETAFDIQQFVVNNSHLGENLQNYFFTLNFKVIESLFLEAPIAPLERRVG